MTDRPKLLGQGMHPRPSENKPFTKGYHTLRTLVNFVSFKTITLIGGQFLSISIIKSKFNRGHPYEKTSSHNCNRNI